ncbi:hypothetical protein [Acetobacter persici]|uniref:hypothetical protein n=1 Tax=Acetobacter persici TaxID=1076596 RepID=UPI0012FD0EBB|nr:hypothetical protein [Acetobacter persici]
MIQMKYGKKTARQDKVPGQISSTSPNLLLTSRNKSYSNQKTFLKPSFLDSCSSSRDIAVLLSPACVQEMEAVHAKGAAAYSEEKRQNFESIGAPQILSATPTTPNPYPVLCHISFFPSAGESIIHDVRISSAKDCMVEADIISRGHTGHEAVTIDDENSKAHFDVACVRSSPLTIACHAR